MKPTTEAELLHQCAAYCSTAERCIHDVKKKIEAAGAAPEVKERILARLQKEKFIDEARFCRSFVNDKLRFNKWGRIKIDYELRQRGIDAQTRTNALDQIENEAYSELLLALLKEKRKSVKAKDDREAYLKLLRFASGRGFESQLTSRCLQKLFKGGDYEDME